MKNHTLSFYLAIVLFGFLYTSMAIFQFSWFYSFGWVLGLILIGAFVGLFPVYGLHRLLGFIIQMFAFFLPIKLFMTLNELGILHLSVYDHLNPLQILGQLFLIILVYSGSFLFFYWLIRKRLDLRKYNLKA